MLADVRVMRHDGRPLDRARLSSVPVKRGTLGITRRRDPWRNEWIPIATLIDDRLGDQLPALDQVRIMRWRGSQLVLVGVEHVGRQKSSKPQLQAWWVQLVNDPALPGTTPPASAG